MIASPDERIRLSVLGGFLGSGKTTWLRHHLHHGSMREALVIVNEAAATPVDDMLLVRSDRLAVLAGGCACCDARDDLVALLRDVCDRRVGSPAIDRVDRIVLETSGLADPGRIAETVATDPVLQHHIVVGEIVVAVDGLHGLRQVREEPLGRRQIETADRLVITKIDQADVETLKRLVATLGVLNPGAAISGAILGSDADLPDPTGAAPEALPELSDLAGAPMTATTLDLDGATDWVAVCVWLSALLHARGDDIVRAKGVLRTPRGRLLLQSVRKVVQAPEILPDETTGSVLGRDEAIVLIGRNFEPAHLSRSLRRFADGAR